MNYSLLLPKRLDDWIAEDNPVRAIDAFVGECDLRARPRGRPFTTLQRHSRLTAMRQPNLTCVHCQIKTALSTPSASAHIVAHGVSAAAFRPSDTTDPTARSSLTEMGSRSKIR